MIWENLSLCPPLPLLIESAFYCFQIRSHTFKLMWVCYFKTQRCPLLAVWRMHFSSSCLSIMLVAKVPRMEKNIQPRGEKAHSQKWEHFTNVTKQGRKCWKGMQNILPPQSSFELQKYILGILKFSHVKRKNGWEVLKLHMWICSPRLFSLSLTSTGYVGRWVGISGSDDLFFCLKHGQPVHQANLGGCLAYH